MASIYDDMIGKAADDILASAGVDKPKQYVWCVEVPDRGDTIDLFIFHDKGDAQAFADNHYGYSMWRQEVR